MGGLLMSIIEKYNIIYHASFSLLFTTADLEISSQKKGSRTFFFGCALDLLRSAPFHHACKIKKRYPLVYLSLSLYAYACVCGLFLLLTIK